MHIIEPGQVLSLFSTLHDCHPDWTDGKRDPRYAHWTDAERIILYMLMVLELAEGGYIKSYEEECQKAWLEEKLRRQGRPLPPGFACITTISEETGDILEIIPLEGPLVRKSTDGISDDVVLQPLAEPVFEEMIDKSPPDITPEAIEDIMQKSDISDRVSIRKFREELRRGTTIEDETSSRPTTIPVSAIADSLEELSDSLKDDSFLSERPPRPEVDINSLQTRITATGVFTDCFIPPLTELNQDNDVLEQLHENWTEEAAQRGERPTRFRRFIFKEVMTALVAVHH